MRIFNTMKRRVFAYVEDNSKKNEPSAILAVDETGEHEFRVEVPSDGTDYMKEIVEGNSDSPAAVAFAAFERFCTKECGLKDCNDEVIIGTDKNFSLKTLTEYVDFRLGAMNWAVVKFIDFDYRYETSHLMYPMSFRYFRKTHTAGLEEPFATRALYAKYRELIHKDHYTRGELDRMERAIFSCLGTAYSRQHSRLDPCIFVSVTCAAIYRGDQARFLRVLERIVADYANRRSERKRWVLKDMLAMIADNIFGEGEIDFASLAEEEKKPPLKRKEYSIFAALSPEALLTVKPIIEELAKGT